MSDTNIADKISVGILLTGCKIPAWQQLAIRKVTELDFVEVKAVFIAEGGDPHRDQYPQFALSHWLMRLLARLDSHLFGYKRKPDAFVLVDIKEALGDIDGIPIELGGEPGSRTLRDTDCASVASARLDLLIDAGVWLAQKHCDLAKYGIWRNVHDPYRSPADAMPGFWESLDNHPVTGSRLEILMTASKLPIVVDRSWSTTYHLSPSANRNYFSWTSSSFLARQIRNLHHFGATQFFSRFHTDTKENRCDLLPVQTIRSMFFYWFRYISKIARRVAYEKVYWDQWYLLFSLDPSGTSSICNFTDIVPPKDEFWADPHVVQRGDSYFVFLEVYTKESGKGHISVLEIDQDGNYGDPIKILEADYHLSYPMIIEDGGKFFMIPETKENRTIELYECLEFPYEWKFCMNLMSNVRATDATPIWYEGKWWMFATIAEVTGSQCREELYLYHSEKLLSDQWTPHPLNPVISDARSARPAGKVFLSNGKLMRPSQDCSYIYGYGLVFNEIRVLTEADYCEEVVSSITPEWESGVSGVHSYSRDGSLIVIDALRGVRRL